MSNTKVSLEPMAIEGMLIGLESEYLRFEADTWYKRNLETDSYMRVQNCDFLEDLYKIAKQQQF